MRVFVLLVALAGAALSPVAAAEPTEPSSKVANNQKRVRTQDARIREALAIGEARSVSFREVLARVESRDVIVYIEQDPRLRGRLAGRMRWVAATKDARYVRVSVNPELTGAAFIATIAHELQHVAEVGDAATVVDEPTLNTLYKNVGTQRRARSSEWDTEAAQVTGEVVRKELVTDAAVEQQPSLDGMAARRR